MVADNCCVARSRAWLVALTVWQLQTDPALVADGSTHPLKLEPNVSCRACQTSVGAGWHQAAAETNLSGLVHACAGPAAQPAGDPAAARGRARQPFRPGAGVAVAPAAGFLALPHRQLHAREAARSTGASRKECVCLSYPAVLLVLLSCCSAVLLSCCPACPAVLPWLDVKGKFTFECA